MKCKPNEKHRDFSLVELFCGCGGFSHGFRRTEAFEIICGCDVKGPALETFRRNNLNFEGRPPETILDDIRGIEISKIETLLADRGVVHGELDCLIGGPPCQGFSQLRRSKEREQNKIVRFRGYNHLDEDPRNDLVLRFLEIAAVLRPKIIVIENVPQMMSHSHEGVDGGIAILIENLLKEMGYEVNNAVLNAADFGVPQIRQRVFIMASRIGKPSFPKASHVDPFAKGLLESKNKHWVTVNEAISDLPIPPVGSADILGGGSATQYLFRANSGYGKKMQSRRYFPYNHVTRQYDDSVISIIKNMLPGETWNEASARKQLEFEKTIQSERENEEDMIACRKRLITAGRINAAFYKSYYWSAYTRLHLDQPALTITANANFLGSGRFTHPDKDRGITIREAARLQSFEDEFTFLTSSNGKDLTTNIGVGLDMIGEAVPPLLAEAIARKALELLNAKTIGSQTNGGLQ
ncbi:MAG: DNA cytosine methyltransferase [Candidatus Pacebacteria bacterium]|nr:DNA cytosine methyltransferase [Candidatus Paceibacterota bacterium]